MRYTKTVAKLMSDFKAHKSIISKVSSRKYQLFEAQSTAIWCIDLKEYISGIGITQLLDKFLILAHSIVFRLFICFVIDIVYFAGKNKYLPYSRH